MTSGSALPPNPGDCVEPDFIAPIYAPTRQWVSLDEDLIFPPPPEPKRSSWPARLIRWLLIVLIVLAMTAGSCYLVFGPQAKTFRSGNYPAQQLPPQLPDDTSSHAIAVSDQMRIGVGFVTGNTDNTISSGTGLVLREDGVVVTNYHVVQHTKDLSVRLSVEGETYDAEVLGYSQTLDIAVLQLVTASGLTPIEIANRQPFVGDEIVSVGNARGGGVLRASSGYITSLDETVRVASSYGGFGEDDLVNMYAMTTGAVPGYSGGPTFNRENQVIAMTTAGSERITSSSQSYAIPISRVRQVVDQVLAGTQSDEIRIGPPAFLGITISGEDVPAVSSVIASGPAAQAGVQPGDLIMAIDDEEISTAKELLQILSRHDPGDQIALRLRRLGSPVDVTVTLTTSPAN